MGKKELLIKEIDNVPDPVLDELLDFLEFLKARFAGDRMEMAAASESSLRKDWLRPEEDEAWRSL